MGLVSSDVRKSLEAVQGQSLSVTAAMGAMQTAFGRNAGAMERLSATYNGRMSTLKDTIAALYRELGTPIRDALKPFIEKATVQLESLLPVAQRIGMGIAENLLAAYEIVASGNLSGVLSVGLVAAAKMFGAAMVDAITRPTRIGIATLFASFEAVANMFGTSLDTVFLSAKVAMKQLLVDAMTFTSLMRGGKGAPASLQISLAQDTVALHRARNADAMAEPTWAGNFKKWFDRLPSVVDMTKESSLADLKKVWADFVAAARGKLGEMTSAGESSATKPDASASAGAATAVNMAQADRLAKIGGFIGGAGGPATDYARRTAAATERLVSNLAKLPADIARAIPTGGAAAWA